VYCTATSHCQSQPATFSSQLVILNSFEGLSHPPHSLVKCAAAKIGASCTASGRSSRCPVLLRCTQAVRRQNLKCTAEVPSTKQRYSATKCGGSQGDVGPLYGVIFCSPMFQQVWRGLSLHLRFPETPPKLSSLASCDQEVCSRVPGNGRAQSWSELNKQRLESSQLPRRGHWIRLYA
jgi:hypothetical protein